MSHRHEVKSLIKRLREQGWTAELSKGSHWRLTAPDGRRTGIGSTPSDRRSLLNARAQLRRMGADL